jgi:protein-disulfide isomerase
MTEPTKQKPGRGPLIAVFVFLIAIVAFYGFSVQKAPKPADTTAGTETPIEAATQTAVAPASTEPTAATETPAATAEQTATPSEEGSKDLLAAPSSMILDVSKIMQDRVLGNPDAPVTIIEYASMTCPHCAHFATTVLPDVKKQLIDTGKAKLIYRDFPLDTFALRTAMMARCAEPDKYYSLIEVLFKNQDRWTKSDNPIAAVSQLGTLAGMDDAYIKQCMESVELEAYILRGVQDAQKNYNLKSTPTFVFNDGQEMLSGGHNVEDFINIVNKLSGGK